MREVVTRREVPRERVRRQHCHDLDTRDVRRPLSFVELLAQSGADRRGRDLCACVLVSGAGGKVWGSTETNVENWKAVRRLVGHDSGTWAFGEGTGKS